MGIHGAKCETANILLQHSLLILIGRMILKESSFYLCYTGAIDMTKYQ